MTFSLVINPECKGKEFRCLGSGLPVLKWVYFRPDLWMSKGHFSIYSMCHGSEMPLTSQSDGWLMVLGLSWWGRRAESAEESVTSANGLCSRGTEQGGRGEDVVLCAGRWWWSCGLLAGRFLRALSTGMSWTCGSEPRWSVLCVCLGVSRAPGTPRATPRETPREIPLTKCLGWCSPSSSQLSVARWPAGPGVGDRGQSGPCPFRWSKKRSPVPVKCYS